MYLFGGSIRFIVRKMPLHPGYHLLGDQIRPPLGIPAVGAGNVPILTGKLNKRCDLGIEGVGMLITNADITKVNIFAMIILEHTHPTGIGEIAGGTRDN